MACLSSLDLLAACEACYDHPDITAGPDDRDGALVLPAPDGGTLIVFRGTVTTGETGFLDWLNDLRAELVNRPEYPGKVHAGFAASLDDLWPKLPALTPPLTIAGHSKGGALAVLAAARLYRSASLWRDNPPGGVTFAAPMVGDYSFAGGMTFLPFLAYVNPHDIVPRLPPIGYWPTGRRISAPPSWTAPHGVAANHHLETGYKPWIAELILAA